VGQPQRPTLGEDAAVRRGAIYVELTQAHRYALVLEHDGMERWQWVRR